MLSLQLLGEVAVERDGEPVPLSANNRRLLAFLALHPGLHERDALASRFWPDAPDARANLRTAVWALRQALGTQALVTSRSAIALGDIACDLNDLERDGEWCAGFHDDWAVAARDEHRRRRVARLDALVANTHNAAAAAALAARRCALTPLDEAAHRVLIESLAAAGDRAGALVVGRELAERLRTEIGVALAPSTRALLARLRGPTGGDQAAALERPRPMFGRGRELAALTVAWAAARNGRGRVVVLTGEAGIGKTRLVAELARRAHDNGARVAVGAGVDVGGEAPLAVWHELVRTLVISVPRPPSSAGWPAELGRLAPDLAGALGIRTPPLLVAAPELERLRLFDAVLRLVEWAATGRPVLLVAEDIHRADRASLALCAHIGRRLAGMPVLLVLTRRDRPARADADALLADLAGRGLDVIDLELGPVQHREVAEIARSVVALSGAALDEVTTAADGNPLLAVESARAWTSGRTAPAPGLRAMVRAALGRVPDRARDLAEAIAAAGRALTGAEMAALPVTADAERAALDTGLIARVRGGLGYRHALLAEAARAELRDPEGTHLAVAQAIETAATPQHAAGCAAEVARHLQRAGRTDLAGPRWQQAAHHARSLGALPEAASFWEEATRADPRDARSWLELAETYAWLGRSTEFDSAWETALTRLAPQDRAAAWCRRGLWFKTVACNPNASLAAYRRAAELLPSGASNELRAQVLLGLAWNEASAGDPTRAEPLLAQAVLLVPEPDAETTAEQETARLIAMIRVGAFGDCEAVAVRAAAAIAHVRRPDLDYVVWTMTACALACAGDFDGALRTADRGVAATRGIPVVALQCLAARTHLLSRLNRHEEAAAAADELLATAERLDSPPIHAVARYDAGLVALAAGSHRRAADLIGTAIADHAAVSMPAARLAIAEALAGAGEPTDANAELRRAALEPVRRSDQPWALVPRMARVQGLVAWAAGDLGLARHHLSESAEGWRRRGGTTHAPGEEYMAALVDLGRPPVVGLVDPAWELDRVLTELTDLDAQRETACPGSP